MTSDNQMMDGQDHNDEAPWLGQYWGALNKVADRMPAVRIAVIYGVISAVWILFSDRFINFLTDDPNLLSTLQTYKGLAFIVLTTLGLYALVLAQTRAIRLREHRAEEQARLQENIASLGRAALEAKNLDELYSRVLQQVAKALSVDLAKIARVDGSSQQAEIVEGIGWRDGVIEQIEVPISPEYLAGQVLQARRPIIVERLVQADEFKIPEFLIEEGAVSSMVAPISNDEPLGVLGVHHKSFRRYTRYEANYLQAVANLLGQAIHSFQSQAKAKQRSELLDSIGQAVMATDPEGQIFYWNKAAERMYGWSRDEVIGRSVLDLTPALGQDQRAAEIMKQMRMGQSWQGEFRLRRKDGTEFVALVRNSVLRDQQGDVTGIIGVTTDITRIKEAQRALQRATERLNLLHAIDKQILSGTTMVDISRSVLESLDKQIHFGSSLVLEYEKGGGRVHKLASINGATAFEDGGWHPMSFIGMPSQPELPPEPYLYFPDLEPEAGSFPVFDDFLAAGQKSLLVARLRVAGEALGSIVLSRPEIDAFAEEEINLLLSVADSLAVGLHGAQLREAEEKRARELESLQRISISLVSELGLDELLVSTARAAYDLFAADDAYLFLYEAEKGELEFAAGWNQDGLMRESRYQPREQGITMKVARSGQRAAFTQVADHELFVKDFPDWQGSLISQPIVYRDVVVGVFNLSFLNSRRFTASDLQVIELLADLAAVAIHNAQQYHQLQRRQVESEALFRVTQRLAGEYQLQDVLDAVVYSVHEIIEGAEAASLWLGEGDEDALTAEAWYGLPDEVMEEVTFPTGQSCVGYVIEKRLPLKVDDTSESEMFRKIGHDALDSVRSLIGVPIWVGQEVIGALFADNYQRAKAFDQEDFRMLELLANQAATAIERARLFDQILAGRQRLEQLSRELVQVQEEERSRLARELHDEIGQLLTGLKLTLEMAQDEPLEGGKVDLTKAVDIADELLTDVRDLSLRLRPSMLDDLGLLPTLLWLIKRADEQLGLTVEISHDGIEDQRFPNEVETTAYRVAQESLTNIARHAGVDRAWLTVRVEADQLKLQVHDEGVGFEPDEVRQLKSAKGLSGMRERAKLLGGELLVNSAPDQGSTITLLLPLKGTLERRSRKR